jgi:hypothetical protein
MITTSEAIGDPVGFLLGDETLVDNMNNGELCISGEDIVMLLTSRPHRSSTEGVRRTERNINPILGHLYRGGKVFGAQIGGGLYNIDWFPSATYSNNLSELLDRKPGEDVLKFVDSDHASIPDYSYVDHLAKGEFPQATSGDMFEHDRWNDHAPGALLSPPIVTKSTMELAVNLDLSSNGRWQRRKVSSLTKEFDVLTAEINHFTGLVVPNLNKGWEQIAIDPTFSMLENKVMNAAFFGLKEKISHSRNNYRIRNEIGKILFDHLAELVPKIENLKNEYPQPKPIPGDA